MFQIKNSNKKGYSLVEVLVSVAVFAVLASVVWGVAVLIIDQIRIYRDKSIVSLLADQYIEVARNLPYAYIGTLHGTTCDRTDSQPCTLPDLAEPDTVNYGGVDYTVYYSISYVDDPADGSVLLDTDDTPNDYKQVKLYVVNTNTNVTKYFMTNISSQGLENMGDRGAISVLVMDAFGAVLPGATVHIINEEEDIDVTRITDASGTWLQIGVPPGVLNYHISVTKDGYSSDQTYPITVSNPVPVQKDLTVVEGKVSGASFSIDKLSKLSFRTLSQTCQPVSGVGLGVRGSKLIGSEPEVHKFDKSYISDGSGYIYPKSDDSCTADKCLEWGNYDVALTGETYMVYGTQPVQYTNILPDSSQSFVLLIGPKTSNSFLVIVKDGTSNNAIEGATVNLTGPNEYDETKITGGSVLYQNNWTGGDGQEDFTDESKYFEGSNVSTAEEPHILKLSKIGENYQQSGHVISSTFDTGTEETNYTTLVWSPSSQLLNTQIEFQLASNNDNETWEFVGPDGTVNTRYTVSNNISSTHNNNRYIRYKAYLSTSDLNKSPELSDITINYVSGCHAPGQAMFAGLSSGSGYNLSVNATGYQSQTFEDLEISGSNRQEVLLNP